MRFVTASTFAAILVLFPCKLQAFHPAPEDAQPLREMIRQVAEPDTRKISATSPESICATVVSAAARNDLPVIFFLRLIWQESRFDPFAISRAGALGVAQFMPEVAKAVGLSDPFDPAKALPASARFLRQLHERFGNLGLAAAAYNAGTGRIREWLARRGDLPQETRDYVLKITGRTPEAWVRAAFGEIELKMPPAPCDAPESLTIPIGSIPHPVPRPRLQPEPMASEVSASARRSRMKRTGAAERPKKARAAVPSRGRPKRGSGPGR